MYLINRVAPISHLGIWSFHVFVAIGKQRGTLTASETSAYKCFGLFRVAFMKERTVIHWNYTKLIVVVI